MMFSVLNLTRTSNKITQYGNLALVTKWGTNAKLKAHHPTWFGLDAPGWIPQRPGVNTLMAYFPMTFKYRHLYVSAVWEIGFVVLVKMCIWMATNVLDLFFLSRTCDLVFLWCTAENIQLLFRTERDTAHTWHDPHTIFYLGPPFPLDGVLRAV